MTTWYRRDASFNSSGKAQSTPTLLHLSCSGDRMGRARCAPHGKRRILLLTLDNDGADAVDDPEMWRCCKRCWWIRQKEMLALQLDREDAKLLVMLLTSMDDCRDEVVQRQAKSIEDRLRGELANP